jgi:DNA polymerase-1
MTKAKKKRVVLLDTHAILHRAYHALPDFTSPSGEPTGALYGLTAFLLKVLDDLHPDYIIAAYDLPGPTLRHEMYEDYKGTREKTDDSLVSQLESSRDILNALSVPYIEAPGYEADDILGTLSEVFKKDKALEVLIASGDMDTLQLVDKKAVQVYTLKRGINDTIVYDEAAVKERYGFGPELVVDYKGLRGDPSDNIPGIRGIGEKTATTLITNFGDIESIYKTLKEHPEKYEKAGIKPRIMNLLTEGEDDALFSKELATIHRDAPIETPALNTEWTGNINLEDALSVFKELGFRTLSERLKKKLGSEEEVKEEKVEEKVNTKKLEKAGLMLWVLRSDITNPTLEDMLEYTSKSTFAEAKEAIQGELEEQKLNDVYENIELPLIPVVHRMEKRGILLDTEYLKTLSRRYHKDLDALEKKIYKTAGEEFNIKSPKQLGEILFEKLGIGGGKGKKTATGQRSTRESELKKYEQEEPIIHDILEYRELQKLLSTYIDNLPKMTDDDGRLHAHFSQTGTTTGRMSSAAPNMQNIPIRTTRGNAIRKAITAPKGHVLVSADYSQIELRVAAFVSGDKKLIQYFTEDKDIHSAVAAEVFGVPEPEVTKDMRRKAKAINFGILYGMGSNALSVATGTTRKEAKAYLEDYFERFKGVSAYVEDIKNTLRNKGYTETWFGRKRYFEGIKSPLPHIQAQAERMALNAPIQGTSADVMKIAMVEMDKQLRKKKIQNDAFLVAQIHDELLYEVKKGKEEMVAELLRKTMEEAMSLTDTQGVPLKVDVEVGTNWGEMKRV